MFLLEVTMINAVIAAVGTMLVLSLSRVHVVIAIIVGALVGGLTGGLGIEATLKAFNGGLGGGATVALSYALLGAFAVAIAKSGLAHALADKALMLVDRQEATGGSHVKWLLIGLLWVVAIASQNILPIHIAFIPLLVPPLLYVLTKLQLDRRRADKKWRQTPVGRAQLRLPPVHDRSVGDTGALHANPQGCDLNQRSHDERPHEGGDAPRYRHPERSKDHQHAR
jgi:hypothetical protein